MTKLLFFTQPGCAGCIQLKPIIQEFAGTVGVGFEEVDITTEENQFYVSQLGITVTPSLSIEKDNALFTDFFWPDAQSISQGIGDGQIEQILNDLNQVTPPPGGQTQKISLVIWLFGGLVVYNLLKRA